MNQERMREYHFDGIILKVPLYYDKSTGCYYEQFPDFEKEQIYNSSGQPLVCAAQDACNHAHSKELGYCLDCGGCRFFSPKHPDELIGTCSQPHRAMLVQEQQTPTNPTLRSVEEGGTL